MISSEQRGFSRCSHNRASLREGSGTEGDDRSLRRCGFDDRFGTFYTSLILAGSLSLASARQLPPGRSLYTHKRVGTKRFSAMFAPRAFSCGRRGRKARKRDVIPFSMAFDGRHPIVPSRTAMEESRCQRGSARWMRSK